ncbi:MAG: deoxynucleoside kinase [Nitrospinota bacterium]
MSAPRYRYIAIEGPIGVGTTSLTAMLARQFGAAELYEKVDDNPFLAKFYEDREKYALSTQLFFLVSRYRQLGEANQLNLFQKNVVADYMLEKDLIFAELNLNSDEYEIYNEIYRHLSVNVARPDLVIFLTAQTDRLIERVRMRGRDFESGISEKYIKEVNEAYHRFFFRYDKGPMLQVNTNEIDFVKNKEDFQKLLDKISSPVKGREFFNPLGST